MTWRWLRRSLPLVVLLAFCARFFFPLFTGHTFTAVAAHYQAVYPWKSMHSPYNTSVQSDQADLTFPWRTFMQAQLSRGTFPFWNPYSFGGQPFFSNGSSGVLYPPNFVAALLVSPSVAHDAVSLLHMLCSGLFMYLLLREWRFTEAGALFGGVTWMLSSMNLAWLHLEVVAPVAMWLPLSLMLVTRGIDRDEWVSAIGAGAALACALIAGHLLFGGVVFGVTLAYAAGLTIRRMLSRGAEPLVRLTVVALLPFCLAAIVLWPTFLFITSLGRQSLPYDDAIRMGIRVPYSAFRYLLSPPPVPASEATLHMMVYLGVLTPFLAVIGFFQRGHGTFFARLMVLTTFLIVTDTVILRWAYVILPPLTFFSPLGRLLNLFNFGMVVLAASGLDVISRWVSRRWMIAACAGFAIGVTGYQLVTYGRALNPLFVPREARWLFPRTPLIDALGEQGAINGTAPGRILPVRLSQRNGWTPPVLFADEPMLFGIDSAGGYDSTLPSRAEDVLRVMAGEKLEAVLALKYRRAFLPAFDIDHVKFSLLPRLGITTIVAPPRLSTDPLWQAKVYAPLQLAPTYSGEDGETFRIVNGDGGPWLVHQFLAADSPERAAALFLDPAFDHRKTAVFEQRDAHGLAAPRTTVDLPEHVDVYEDGINSVRIRVNAAADGWLVIPNVWDPGWTATIDGRSAPVLRANYAFQAIGVTAGETSVSLKFVPRGFYPGLALSLFSLGGAVVALAAMQRRSVN